LPERKKFIFARTIWFKLQQLQGRLGEVNDRLGKIWEKQVLKTFLYETMDMDIARVVSDRN
jgi:hypothetical protein